MNSSCTAMVFGRRALIASSAVLLITIVASQLWSGALRDAMAPSRDFCRPAVGNSAVGSLFHFQSAGGFTAGRHRPRSIYWRCASWTRRLDRPIRRRLQPPAKGHFVPIRFVRGDRTADTIHLRSTNRRKIGFSKQLVWHSWQCALWALGCLVKYVRVTHDNGNLTERRS